MRRRFGSRLSKLDQHLHPHDPPVTRLLFLLPDLWPAGDQTAYRSARNQEDLSEVIARRTGVRPTFGVHAVSTITVPVPDDLLARSEAEKAAYLAQHESRPHRPDERKG